MWLVRAWRINTQSNFFESGIVSKSKVERFDKVGNKTGEKIQK